MSKNIAIDIQVANELYAPEKAYDTDAAYDVRACLVNKAKPFKVMPGKTEVIALGFALGLPEGFEALISPRSGLAAKSGITILNSPGVIDADYRGEVKVILHNTGDKPFFVNDGDRIAQMRIKEVLPTSLNFVEKLSETVRGESGFGSTGDNGVVVNPTDPEPIDATSEDDVDTTDELADTDSESSE